jgi:hypothetical protein
VDKAVLSGGATTQLSTQNPPRQSCCLSASDFIQTSAHGFLQRKCAQTLRKMQLSTKKALLYYYCYFNIKLLKNNLSTAGGKPGRVVNT